MGSAAGLEKRAKILVVACAAALLLAGVMAGLRYAASSRLYLAVGYLRGHFSEAVGLIYESDDRGSQTISGLNYSHSQIYYVYSDNFLAEWALRPYEQQISSRINQTIQACGVPPSGFFEVLFGKTIPQNISVGAQSIVNQYPDRVIMAELHNTSISLRWEEYGDTLIYQSLNSYIRGNRTGAGCYFDRAYRMWDGKGINDTAARSDGRYANYKLALVLYASEILGLTIGNYTQIETKLWSMQQPGGGITSLADRNGNPIGTANAETTSIALLPYDGQLILRIQSANKTSFG